MNQPTLIRSTFDLGSMEKEIQCRLRRGKTRLLISHILCFILAMSVIFFVI